MCSLFWANLSGMICSVTLLQGNLRFANNVDTELSTDNTHYLFMPELCYTFWHFSLLLGFVDYMIMGKFRLEETLCSLQSKLLLKAG